MGNDQAEPVPAKQLWNSDSLDDIYMLEDVKGISLKQSKQYMYYWIDPKIHNNENMKYKTYLKKSIHIDGFTSCQGMYTSIAEEN